MKMLDIQIYSKTKKDVRHGCTLSSLIFNVYTEDAIDFIRERERKRGHSYE